MRPLDAENARSMPRPSPTMRGGICAARHICGFSMPCFPSVSCGISMLRFTVIVVNPHIPILPPAEGFPSAGGGNRNRGPEPPRPKLRNRPPVGVSRPRPGAEPGLSPTPGADKAGGGELPPNRPNANKPRPGGELPDAEAGRNQWSKHSQLRHLANRRGRALTGQMVRH